ncbi:MAG TPA: hypothetical protein PLD59_04465 [Tepidisphaeraceae bacterium]|nr:hypothetical protein [Tepidisphaeraceae bacterium]
MLLALIALGLLALALVVMRMLRRGGQRRSLTFSDPMSDLSMLQDALESEKITPEEFEVLWMKFQHRRREEGISAPPAALEVVFSEMTDGRSEVAPDSPR